MAHVLTVIGGHGIRAIPYAPFRAWVLEGAGGIEVERTGGVVGRARILVGSDGDHEILPIVGSADHVVDVAKGPSIACWMLQTSRLSLPFPLGYTLLSVPDGSASPFDLVGGGGELIYLQGARPEIAASQLVAEGQTVTAEDEDLLEVAYEHRGQRWTQRHRILRVQDAGIFVLTVQATPATIESARVVLDEMAQGARPT